MRIGEVKIIANRLTKVLEGLGYDVKIDPHVKISFQFVRFRFRLSGKPVEGLTSKIQTLANATNQQARWMRLGFKRGKFIVDIWLHDAKDRLILRYEKLPRREGRLLVPAKDWEAGTGRNIVGVWLGIDIEGNWRALHVNDPRQPHVLITGSTGCGKSNLLKSLILQYAERPSYKVSQIILDPNNIFNFADQLPNLARKRAIGRKQSAQILPDIVKLVESKADDELNIIVIIDELVDVLDEDPIALDSFRTLVTSGRNRNIWIIAATQKPLAGNVDSIARSQLRQRIMGPVENKREGTMVAGDATIMGFVPGNGSFVHYRINTGDSELLQVPFVSNEYLSETFRLSDKSEDSPAVFVDQEVLEIIRWLENGYDKDVLSQRDVQGYLKRGVNRAREIIKELQSYGIIEVERKGRGWPIVRSNLENFKEKHTKTLDI